MTVRESPEAHASESRRSDTALLLYAWLGPPVVWFVYLNVQYPLAHFACTAQLEWPLHVTPLLALAGTIGGGVAGLKRWRRRGAHRAWSADGAEDAGPAEGERRTFLAIMGVALSALFSALVIMQWIPTVLFHPCQQ